MEQPSPPPVRTSDASAKRVVGFAPPAADTSPSSVLRQSPRAAETPTSVRGEPVESPLAAAFRRERSVPSLPALPKLKLGKGKGGGLGMPRSKSSSTLGRPAGGAADAVEVPPGPQTRSATSSPHAASSAGSEPVRIE